MNAVALLAAQVSAMTPQGFLDAVQASLTGGAPSGAQIIAFDEAQRFLDPDDVMGKLQAYLDGNGFRGPVPNVNRVLDTDGDGVVNSEDDCPLIANADQRSVRGVCAHRKLPIPAPGGVFTFGPSFPLTGDVDGDGDADYVSVAMPYAFVYANDGKGHLTPSKVDISTPLGYSPTAPQSTVASAALGDVSHDGKVDLVVSIAVDGGAGRFASLELFPGNGDGTFAAPVRIWSNEPRGCVPDGLPCTVKGAPCCSGTCLASSTKVCAPGPVPSALTRLQLVDVTEDGLLDIVAGNPAAPGSGNSVIAGVLVNPGSGSWPAPSTVRVAGASDQVVSLAGIVAGRFDADAHVDLLALVNTEPGGGGAAPGLYLLSGDGGGRFALADQSALADGCSSSLAAGDFDEDGKLDVALLDRNATELTVAFGAGNGKFGAAVRTAVGAEPSVITRAVTTSPGCPVLNSVGKPGFGSGYALHAGHYTGASHFDLAAGNVVFVSNGRAAPSEQFVRSATYAPAVPTAQNPLLPPPANADYDGDGVTDVLEDGPGVVALVNPAGYRSW